MNPPTKNLPTIKHPDRGSATIFAVGLAGLIAACALAATALGVVVVARHEAGNAADLAALAAAVHADAGECSWADTVAREQGAHMVSCHCADAVCDVRASVDTPWGAADVSARAGPDVSAQGVPPMRVEPQLRPEPRPASGQLRAPDA